MSHAFHQVWREQLAAVPGLRRDFGENTAFDYIIGEKLMNFAEAAERHPQFAQELPAFVAAIRSLFSPEVVERGLRRLERHLAVDEEELDRLMREEGEDWLAESPAVVAARRGRFARLGSLLTIRGLGTA